MSEDEFRMALGAWPSGVAIVTALRDGDAVGMTVSAFFSVSLSPPLVGICLDDRSQTLGAVEKSRAFGVSVLHAGQAELSERFARPGNEDERFDGLELETPPGSHVPLIGGALVHLACDLAGVHPAGDHRVCLGRVKLARRREGSPLVYHSARYQRISPLDEAFRGDA